MRARSGVVSPPQAFLVIFRADPKSDESDEPDESAGSPTLFGCMVESMHVVAWFVGCSSGTSFLSDVCLMSALLSCRTGDLACTSTYHRVGRSYSRRFVRANRLIAQTNVQSSFGFKKAKGPRLYAAPSLFSVNVDRRSAVFVRSAAPTERHADSSRDLGSATHGSHPVKVGRVSRTSDPPRGCLRRRRISSPVPEAFIRIPLAFGVGVDRDRWMAGMAVMNRM